MAKGINVINNNTDNKYNFIIYQQQPAPPKRDSNKQKFKVPKFQKMTKANVTERQRVQQLAEDLAHTRSTDSRKLVHPQNLNFYQQQNALLKVSHS